MLVKEYEAGHSVFGLHDPDGPNKSEVSPFALYSALRPRLYAIVTVNKLSTRSGAPEVHALSERLLSRFSPAQMPSKTQPMEMVSRSDVNTTPSCLLD